jgi:type VI secretion system protein ImpJ
VYLALPVRRDGAVEISRKDGTGKLTRYALREWEARDATRETSERVPLEVAGVQARLVLQDAAFEDLTHIPVAMVREVRSDRSVVLDENFMPTTIDVGACPPLRQFLGELLGMVKQRADVLSAVVTATGRGGAAEFGEFLRLQTMNRYEPLLLHSSRVQPLHPEELYCLLLELAGELATISSSSRRLQPLPAYQQDSLRESFEPLIQTLRGYLSAEQLSKVVAIPIEQRQNSLFIAKVVDTSLFEQATFILAVRADQPADALRRNFSSMAKIAPVTLLKRYVETITPGIALQPVSVLPPSIPYHAGYVYFELDRGHESWRELNAAGAFGLFVPEAFPGLALEMWAMRRS